MTGVPVQRLVEERGAVEHVVHGRDFGDVPLERLVEQCCVFERAFHGGDAGRVPVGDVGVHGFKTHFCPFEDERHVGDKRCVPIAYVVPVRVVRALAVDSAVVVKGTHEVYIVTVSTTFVQGVFQVRLGRG